MIFAIKSMFYTSVIKGMQLVSLEMISKVILLIAHKQWSDKSSAKIWRSLEKKDH